MKILHISTRNVFIEMAIYSFERVAPGANTVWLKGRKKGEVINPFMDHSSVCVSAFNFFNPLLAKKLSSFDLVVLHSLNIYWLPIIVMAPSNVRFAWVGWGYDYHKFMYDERDYLYLNKTKIFKMSVSEGHSLSLKGKLKRYISSGVFSLFEERVLKRIETFSPVIFEEYKLIEEGRRILGFPKYMPWNYGGLKGYLVRGVVGQRCSGRTVLLGNSASFTNNHLDAFDVIRGLEAALNKSIKIVVPLSYGDSDVRNHIVDLGRKQFSMFTPLTEFVSLDKYVLLLKECGFAVFNHKCQEAVGNIIIMLYLGARVFLREESPVYLMFKSKGAVINSVQELLVNPELIELPLAECEIARNISILESEWSQAAVDKKTELLVGHYFDNKS